MTIHIESIAALSPAAADAMRRGVEVECGECEGSGQLTTVNIPWTVDCRRCSGRGRVRYHDVTRGALENWRNRSASDYENDIRNDLDADHSYMSEYLRQQELSDALSAIQPGDVLVHDGTDLGRKCAEVVARVAAERGAK